MKTIRGTEINFSGDKVIFDHAVCGHCETTYTPKIVQNQGYTGFWTDQRHQNARIFLAFGKTEIRQLRTQFNDPEIEIRIIGDPRRKAPHCHECNRPGNFPVDGELGVPVCPRCAASGISY